MLFRCNIWQIGEVCAGLGFKIIKINILHDNSGISGRFRMRFLHTRKTILPNRATKVTIRAHNSLLTELIFRLINKTNAMHHRITMPIMNSCQRPNIVVENGI